VNLQSGWPGFISRMRPSLIGFVPNQALLENSDRDVNSCSFPPPMKKRILIVEDDPALSRVLRDNLLFEGFDVESIADGSLALAKAKAFVPDLVVLDISLPGINGFELCGTLRQRGRTPILILTARSQKADKLRGLNLGADDYITKPFDLEEFLARVKAVLRRARPASEVLVMGPVTIDFVSRTARRGRNELHLTHREFEILQYLAERQGYVVHRDELLRELWGYPQVPFTRSVDNAIARLRKKIEPDLHHPHFIHTVHGDGYTLTPEGQASGLNLK
jgi:DNA-binding response OmpR family regulator